MSRYSIKKSRTPGTIGERLLGIYALYLEEQNKYRIKEVPLVLFENVAKQEDLKPAFDKNNIVITSNFDNNYAPIFGTFLISAMDHFSDRNNYDIVILSRDISAENKKALQKIVSGHSNVSLRYYNPHRFLANIEKRIHHAVYTEDLYYRVIVPYVFKNFDKVLVVDADMICQEDLGSLFEEDISAYLAGAVKDTVMQGYLNGMVPDYFEYIKNTLKIDNPYDYVNTGVILMNCVAIRNELSLDTVRNFMIENMEKFRIYEQDMLNVLFHNQIKFLDQKWNFYTCTNDFVKECINIAPVCANELHKQAQKNPAIVHYAAHPKPWWEPSIELAQEWWEYTRLSPFYELILKCMLNSTPRSENTNINAVLEDVVNYKKNCLKYWRYKILSQIEIGEKRQKYKEKREQAKQRIRNAQEILKR